MRQAFIQGDHTVKTAKEWEESLTLIEPTPFQSHRVITRSEIEQIQTEAKVDAMRYSAQFIRHHPIRYDSIAHLLELEAELLERKQLTR